MNDYAALNTLFEEETERRMKVWICLKREQDEGQVRRYLDSGFEVVQRENVDPAAVDLCIVDYTSWPEAQDQIRHIRSAQDPVMVPLLLMASRNQVEKLSSEVLQQFDEILTTPLRVHIFKLRLRNLRQLRINYLSLQQKTDELQKYRTAMDAANLGIILTDYRKPDNPIVYINEAFREITGYTADEVLGKNCRFMQNGDRQQQGLQEIRKSMKEGKPCRVILRNYKKDGTLFWNNLKIAPIRNANEEVTHFIGIQQDITEEIEAQQKLNREYLKISQLFENDPAAIAECDAEGTILAVNSAFTEIFGYQEEEVVGKNLDALLTRTSEERENAKYMTRIHLKESVQEEMVRYDKDDNPITVLGAGAPIRQDDDIWRFYAIYVDIGEQKRLEEQNKKLLEQERQLRAKAEETRETFEEMFQIAPSAICLLEGQEHTFTFANESYRQLTRKKKYLGRTVNEVFPEIQEQGFYDLLDHVYNSGESHFAEKQPIRLWDEWEEEYFEKTIDFVYKALTDKEGEVYGIFVEAIDVTDEVEYRKQLQERLREKETLLEEIHHRVKNNLAVVSGLLYMQAEKSEDQKVRSTLEDSLNRIQSMALVHEQLYQQSETESAIRMDKYLEKLAATIKKSHQDNGSSAIDLTVDADEISLSLPKAVPVGLITTELVNNAYKHAFPYQSRGNIKVCLKEKNTEMQLSVTDDGKGLEDDFSLATNTSLGMQIIQSLTKQIDGDISFDSKPDEGTNVQIVIPE